MQGLGTAGRTVRAGLLASAALVLSAAGWSPAGAAPLTLDECVRLALRNNLTVEQAEGSVRSAAADVTGARAAFLPQLSVSGRWTKPESPEGDFFGGSANFFEEVWSYSANANVLLFDGWGNVSGYRGAVRGREAAEQRRLDAKQGVVYETERRFFEVLKTEALLDVQAEAAKLSDEQLKKTQAMKELGASTLADVYKSEVDHANNRLEMLRAERNHEVAKAALATYLGLPTRTDLDLVAESLEVAEEAGLEEALARALEVNPLLRANRFSEEASSASVVAAKSDRWPSLTAFYSAGYRFDSPSEFNDDTIETSYGLSMNLNLFDGFQTKSRIRRAESDLLTARRTIESAVRDVEFEVRQAWLDVEIAREAIRVSEEAVRSSEEDLRFAQERFKVGEGTILDVIDAQVNLTRSRSSLVNATYERRLAATALRNAVGDIAVPAVE